MNGDVNLAKDTDRGTFGERAKDTDRGFSAGAAPAADIATDLFRRASQLGGLLVVAVVAPLGSAAGPASGVSAIQRALLNIGEDTLRRQLLEEHDSHEPAPSRTEPERQSQTLRRR